MANPDTIEQAFRPLRIVLLTGLDNSFSAELVKRLQGVTGVSLQHVIYLQNGSSHRRFWWKHEKHRHLGQSRLMEMCSTLQVTLHVCRDMQSADTVTLIRNLGSQILATCGTGVLPMSVSSLPTMGVITLDHGDSPAFNGCPAGFWELWNKTERTQVTVRFIAKDLDSSDVLLQRSIPVCRYDGLRSVEAKLRELSLLVLPRALQTLTTGENRRKEQTFSARPYHHPTQVQRLLLNVKLFFRTLNLWQWIRLALRNSGYFAVLAIEKVKQFALWITGSGTLTVLYYHRVSDLCRDPITIGIADFEKQIRYLKNHYKVWNTDELKACLQQGGRLHGSRNVLITFDDGYEDNYGNAFPILQKTGCEAIFFISTGLIGSEQRFTHDLRMQPDITFSNMSWTQVQTMAAAGMSIGVHSHTHADLGGMKHKDAVAEIDQSVETFRHHLLQEPEWMSFPFGKEKNYSDALINYVEQRTPMIGLFSATGHINQGTIRGYNIQRINIGDGDTGLAFVYKLRGGSRDLLKRK
jgi:peptidoglycan/xylan/chitin deacetylase (PgdA/CDA1 family)